MTISGSIGAASGRRLERKLFAKVAKSLEPGEEPLVGFIAQAPGEISKNVGSIVAVGGANLFNAGVRIGALSRLSATADVPQLTGTPFRAGLVLTDRAVIGVDLNRDAMPKKVVARNSRDAFLGATYLDATYKIAGAEIRSGAIFLRDGRVLVFEISLASRVKFEAFCELLEPARRSEGARFESCIAHWSRPGHSVRSDVEP
jgi:hypothetical protein